MIVSCYGITRFPGNNYAMVLNYHREGNLRDYLRNNHSKLTLKDRTMILSCLCNSLYRIHEKDLMHCDLHSGNMLIQAGGCFITDLGLCGPVDDESSSKIYGIIPYVALEVLQGGKNTKQSDVYSVGMLMWEIFAGHPPFDDRNHGPGLILKICEGLRPPLLTNIPTDCVQMMKKCWDADSSKRPTIDEVWIFVDNKFKEVYENENLKSNTEKEKDAGLLKKLFKFSKIKKNKKNEIEGINDSDVSGSSSSSHSPQEHKKHPSAYHTSRILDDEIAKSKSLKSNDSSLNDLDFGS